MKAMKQISKKLYRIDHYFIWYPIFRFCLPKCVIQALSGYFPKPNTKINQWNNSILELNKYGKNIEAIRATSGSANLTGVSLRGGPSEVMDDNYFVKKVELPI